jgi:hypothetical protein
MTFNLDSALDAYTACATVINSMDKVALDANIEPLYTIQEFAAAAVVAASRKERTGLRLSPSHVVFNFDSALDAYSACTTVINSLDKVTHAANVETLYTIQKFVAAAVAAYHTERPVRRLPADRIRARLWYGGRAVRARVRRQNRA